MAAAKSKNLSSLFAELSKFGQNGNYERAVKAADKILQEAPTNQTAFHCKIVCLIYLQRFADVVQVTGKNPKLAGPLILEKAYAQYRLNRPQDALDTLSAEPTLTLPLKELKAQVLYRLERYAECYDLYRDIIKNSNDEYEDERETNFSAVVANVLAEGVKRDVPKLRMHTYELCYNAACQSLSSGKLAEAKQQLQEAERLCRELLEGEEEGEEEVEEEVGIVRVQLAYCLQLQRKEKEALQVYQATLRRRPQDVGLVAVASNNAVAINRDQNLFDSKKKIKAATADGVEHKLTQSQKRAILLNQALLALHTSQNDQCRRLVANLEKQHPQAVRDAALILAAILAREKKILEAAKTLETYATGHPEEALVMKLATVQLLLSQGETNEACEVLRSLGPQTYKAGIVSALVTLYMHLGDRAGASQVLKEAVAWYQKNKSSGPALASLWRQAASFHLRAGEASLAAQSLEELRRLDPKNQHTLAQLVIAYAQFDPTKAQALSQELPPLSAAGVGELDVGLLENVSWTQGTKYLKKAKGDAATPKIGTPGSELLHEKKKKKRKVRLPKNYDSNVIPDPERWLPRHERSGFKKKKDKRRGDVGKGTQGAATGQSDQYDITKMAPQQKPQTQGAVHATESSGPRWQQKKQKKKKK